MTRGYFYFKTTEVPMLCPPKPWCYHSLTPMLLSGVQFIRLVTFVLSNSSIFLICSSFPKSKHNSSTVQVIIAHCTRYAGHEWKKYFSDVLNEHDRKGHIDVIKYGLDVLGTLPWKVNSKVRSSYLTFVLSNGNM